MPPKSLMELAIMALHKNIKELESVGTMPFELVRDVLPKVDSAYQLRQIELNSTQLQEHTGEIWLKIIERDFPLEYKANPYKPQDPKKWYRVWEKYKKQHEDALQESENRLKNALAGLREDKEKNTSKIVGSKHLPNSGRVGGPKRHYGPRDNSTSVLTFGGGSRTKTSTGASVMRRVRREVKEIATIHGSLSRPIKAAPRPASVRKAPEAMVNDQRRASQPDYRPVAKEPAKLSALEEHERRATFISDSEEEDEDEIGALDKTPVTHKRTSSSDANAQAPAKPAVRVVQKPAKTMLQRKFGQATRSPVKQVASSEKQQPPLATTSASSSKPSPASKPQDKKPSPSTPQKPTSSSSSVKSAERSGETPSGHRSPSRLPQTSTTPPLKDGEGPQSVEELFAELPGGEQPKLAVPPQRKRKAVDIFMRPKRRAM